MPGRARGNQVRLRPKTTRPTKSGYGDWSHHRLRCGISRCAARAGLSSRSSSYTSWHEAGGRYGAVAWRFSRIPTAPSRLSATALASPEHGDPVKRGACFRLARMYHQPPLRRICTALVGTEGSNPVCSSGESTNYGFLGGGGASAVCSAVPNVRIHLPSNGKSANYHSFCNVPLDDSLPKNSQGWDSVA
jgi:hypothetical protein